MKFAKRYAPATLAGLLAVLPAGLDAQAAEYLDHDAFSDALRGVVRASDLAEVRSLGRSHEGRDIWLVTIADPDGPPIETRPGVLVVGTLSGDHVAGSHLALEAIRYLTGPDAGEADLARHVIYVVPRLNPDGAEAMFGGPRSGHRLNGLAFDGDNDGRTDEDGPEDLNGDGVITVMRVPDPAGRYMVDPDEPRLMKRADPAARESGTHTLYWEGVDSDGDGYINEDGPGGVDIDRNFQHEYPYWERDAGHYMVSEPESRALMDFVIANRNIAAILTFGHTDNLVTPPNSRGTLADAATPDLDAFADASLDGIFDEGVWGTPFQPGGLDLRGAQPGRDNDPQSGRRPAVVVDGDDIEYFEAVSDAYREITGIERVGINRTAAGAFFQYGYFHFGVPSFSTQGWPLPEGDAPSEAGTDRRVLAAFDSAGADVFVPWTAYEHADLGAVEIGGFRPYALTNPPAADLPALGEAHGRFVARLSSMLPRVRVAGTEVEAHGGGVFTVRVHVTNEGYLPSSLAHGLVARSVDPITVQIQVPPESILTGASKTHQIRQLEGSGTRETVSWVIRAGAGSTVEIRVRSQKSGSDTATVTLR